MKLSTTLSAAILTASALFLPALCAPQSTPIPTPTPIPTAEPALVDFFTETNYQGDKYYVAHGQYSTCYGVPANLEKVIKSLKLGPGVKRCHLYEDATCKGQKGKDAEYKADQPDVKLPEVLSLKCYKD